MFTGDTQDILTGIFDTPNRELNASQGRWLSPDPAGAGWNQYAYPTNPNSFVDPSGLCPDCDSPHYERVDAIGNWEGDCFVSPDCSVYPAGLFATPDNVQAGLYTYLSSIPGYTVQGGELYWHNGFYTPNPDYDPDTPGSLFGSSTTADFDLGPASGNANNDSWGWTFTKSFFSGFKVEGSRKQGESWSQCVDRAQASLLGSSGTEVLNSALFVGPVASAYTSPVAYPTGMPGVSAVMSGFENDMLTNGNWGLFWMGTRLPMGAISKVSALVTAVAAGVKGGFYTSCAFHRN